MNCNSFGIIDCAEGFMVSPNGLHCQIDFRNCQSLGGDFVSSADPSLEFWVCDECMPGFNWNLDVLDCTGCPEGCETCDQSGACISCFDSYNPIEIEDELVCLPKIQNCKVPMSVQPNGLLLSECETFYICPDCAGVYYQDGPLCTACDIEHCTICEDAHYCTACEEGWMPLVNECVPSTGILNCQTIDSYNNSRCGDCYEGYSLNWDRTRCLDCNSMVHGCSECSERRSLNGDWENENEGVCYKCADNLSLTDLGTCVYNGCADFYVEMTPCPRAFCNVCSDGWGLEFDIVGDGSNLHYCNQCGIPNCIDCMTAVVGTLQINCTECIPGMILDDSNNCVWP